MVHKLRTRDVCHTSPRPSGVQFGIFQAVQSTPLKGRKRLKPSAKDINNIESITSTNIEPIESALPPLNIVNECHEDDDEDDEDDSIVDDSIDLNATKYEQKLHKLVDDYIFQHTFKTRKGVSLYAIKKSFIEDHAFKPNRFSKPVSRYIAYSISTGKLQQITGHGAAGTFRLNREIHRKCVKNQRKLGKVSSHSHAIQRNVSKKSKQHTTVA